MAILYTSPWLIPVGILLIIFNKPIANFMGKRFANIARDAGNPFAYRVIGIIVIITSIVGFFLFK